MQLPSLPTFIWTPLGNIPVLCIEKADWKDDDSGEFDPHARTLIVRSSMALVVQWYFLFHEDMHRMLHDAGVDMPDELEERVCDAYAYARTAELCAAFGHVPPNRSTA